jgi:hypothetical protein
MNTGVRDIRSPATLRVLKLIRNHDRHPLWIKLRHAREGTLAWYGRVEKKQDCTSLYFTPSTNSSSPFAFN